MMLNSRNNAFYGIFMPLHHCLGFPNVILEGGSFDPHDPPGSAPGLINLTVSLCSVSVAFLFVAS